MIFIFILDNYLNLKNRYSNKIVKNYAHKKNTIPLVMLLFGNLFIV